MFRRCRTPVALLVAGSIPFLPACASGEGPIGSTVDKVESAAGNVALPVEREVELGARLAAEFEKEVQLLDDPQVVGYVQEVGQDVVAAAGGAIPEGIQVTFKVIDAPDTVNAVTLPGGAIYVYSGLLHALDDEAQLVGVLSHEVAHVSERHIAEQLAAQYGLQGLLAIALGGGANLLQLIVGQLAGQGALLKFSRSHETEADRVAIDTMIEAGYDPRALADFFEMLRGSARGPVFLQTHPDPGDRIAAIEEAIGRKGRVPTFRGEREYRQLKANLK